MSYYKKLQRKAREKLRVEIARNRKEGYYPLGKATAFDLTLKDGTVIKLGPGRLYRSSLGVDMGYEGEDKQVIFRMESEDGS